MRQSQPREHRLRQLIGTDIPADEVERLTRVDALLRLAADHDRVEGQVFCFALRVATRARRPSYANHGEAVRSTSRPVATRSAATPAARRRIDNETHDLKLTFGELALIHKSLQAAKTLGALPPQDELLNDTIQLVDQALNKAI
jgi:hypothetical protein